MQKKFTYGGKLARENKSVLWKFTNNNDGSFLCPDPEYVSRLYFPLINPHGMKTWVTPDLKGDIATHYHNYLTIPTTTEDINRCLNSRNFWIQIEGKKPWSATGVSAERTLNKWEKNSDDSTFLEAGIGWFKLQRINEKLKIKVTFTIFVPSSPDYVELVLVDIENIGKKEIKLKTTAVTPLYGRSTENLHDHHDVTTMFQHVWVDKYGVRIKGRIIHDERGGHAPNFHHYTMMSFDEKGTAPKYIWGSMRDFIGEGGSLDNPESIYKDLKPRPRPKNDIDGEEAVSACQFAKITLKPKQKKSYIVLHGITEEPNVENDIKNWIKNFSTTNKVQQSLKNTQEFWQKLINNVEFNTEDKNFDNWCRWMNYQVKCRQIYGNAYLPDFDYGKGGRGWRDLWQDLLSIFLIDPDSARQEILNNFLGVRIDGSNANLIGNKSGEFFSDVNRIQRTWCDHSSWPMFVVNFYLQQTGDYDMLFTKVPYWKDQIFRRSKDNDKQYDQKTYGNKQKTINNEVYEGSIFEHLIIQNVCSFYNVGKHNNILLEAADWNDCYDNAREKGESVCFHNFFANNLNTLANLLEKFKKEKGLNEIELMEELIILFDTLSGQQKVDYTSPSEKQNRLQTYYNSTIHTISGKKTKLIIDDLILDLRAKADHMIDHIRTNEWLTTKDNEHFFNGHYDNDSIRIHGDHPNGVRIDLTSQVLPTMFGTATDEQIPVIYKAIKRYLHDKKTGGLRLNSDLKELKLNLGRVAGFAYGYKEHGSKWVHQNVMFLYGLYHRGFVKEGWEVLSGVYNLAMNSSQSKNFPSIPSFYNKNGRGMYVYLSGSATWMIMALTTQVFGIRGEEGHLCIHPKLVKKQFGKKGTAQLIVNFKNKRLNVSYINKKMMEWDKYSIQSISLNGNKLDIQSLNKNKAIISATIIESYSTKEINNLVVELG